MAGQPTLPSFAAIVVAAGSGSRIGGTVPKQFRLWRGKPLLRHSVESLVASGGKPVVIAVPAGEQARVAEMLGDLPNIQLIEGGSTRQLSVKAALEALAANAPERILIHDAARPRLPQAVIARLLDALASHPGVVPGLRIVDSIVREDPGITVRNEDRDAIRRVQTPQAFHFPAILAAHRQWAGDANAGDDAEVLRAAGGTVALVEGDQALRKITFAEDFGDEAPAWRSGTGYDVHRLAAGEELWLGGILIPHNKGLTGHSDADVVLHALTDAILGAAGAGDIGEHFPPSDPQWRGARSARFVEHAVALAAEAGYRIANADLTIICEAPKIGPHKQVMKEAIAAMLGVDTGCVNLKATTTEGLGFTGRGEGIAAQAVVMLQRD
jgi:2-C-methyl-D-erythritol 4-phosphate cytidylyltransferase/2-C-methyl-D-erythritol 2,4-cyclodiphosphate synthase